MFKTSSSPKNFKQLAAGLNVAPAIAELAGSPLWDYLTLRQNFPGSPHHDTKCIVLRGPASSDYEDLNSLDFPYASGLTACRALADDLTARLPAREVGRIFVVSLRAGGHIDRHPDEGKYAAYYDRAHICLSSEEGNIFQCGDESIHMLPGTAWVFNHRIEHEVWNNSGSERVHIIIDYKE